jgi:D-alanine transaminase
MARIIYVNGSYQTYDTALVHVEDRGFQFADGVYEVCEIREGRLIDERLHMDRLHRSLHELRIPEPMSRGALGIVMRETIRRNRITFGSLYLQVTRGVAHRDFAYSAAELTPTVVCYARPRPLAKVEARLNKGARVVTMPDIRWKRPDIKTVSLLANAMARQAAVDSGADEAWLVDEAGFVTEGSACNAWIISEAGEVITRPAEMGILRGVTRTVLISLLQQEGLTFVERPFTINEAKAAREAFNTAATSLVTPVVSIDGVNVGDGRPGPITKRLFAQFHGSAEWSPRHNLLTRGNDAQANSIFTGDVTQVDKK